MALVRVEKLTKTFGTTQAVKPLSFTIGEGRCVALLGPNGAGKTTTIRMLTGLLEPTSGSIIFDETDRGDTRGRIGYLPQTPPAYGWMTGMEFLVHCARLCGMHAKAAREAAVTLLERVGIAHAAKRRISGYSGGMKQRLGLAQALIHKPKLIVLDEPVSALDPVGRREVLELLRELKRETTVLFSTHVLHDAEELCDDIIIVTAGSIALQGALSDIRQQHQKPVITVDTDGQQESMQFLKAWASHGAVSNGGYVQETTFGTHGIRVVVSDLERARQQLLAGLAEANIGVRRIEIGHTSLEDMFMKVVSAT